MSQTKDCYGEFMNEAGLAIRRALFRITFLNDINTFSCTNDLVPAALPMN